MAALVSFIRFVMDWAPSPFGVNHVFQAFVVEGIRICEMAVVTVQLAHLQTVLQHELQAMLMLPFATALDRDVDTRAPYGLRLTIGSRRVSYCQCKTTESTPFAEPSRCMRKLVKV